MIVRLVLTNASLFVNEPSTVCRARSAAIGWISGSGYVLNPSVALRTSQNLWWIPPIRAMRVSMATTATFAQRVRLLPSALIS